MPRKVIIVFILGMALSLASVDVHAQTSAPAEGPVELESLFDSNEGSGELHAIKEKIQSLLRQNEELAPQAQSLKEEFLGLQEQVERSRAEVKALEKDLALNQEKLEQNLKNMRESGQPQSLRLLQSYDRAYEKKQLEIELKLQEFALQEKRQARDHQVAGSHAEPEGNTILEKQLAGEAEELKGKKVALVYELESLKQENILLENQLKLPVTAQNFVGMKLEPGALGESIRRKEAEKARLERRIAQLREEQERSSSQENIPVFETQFRGSVERLEGENKQLKDQIFLYRKKIKN